MGGRTARALGLALGCVLGGALAASGGCYRSLLPGEPVGGEDGGLCRGPGARCDGGPRPEGGASPGRPPCAVASPSMVLRASELTADRCLVATVVAGAELAQARCERTSRGLAGTVVRLEGFSPTAHVFRVGGVCPPEECPERLPLGEFAILSQDRCETCPFTLPLRQLAMGPPFAPGAYDGRFRSDELWSIRTDPTDVSSVLRDGVVELVVAVGGPPGTRVEVELCRHGVGGPPPGPPAAGHPWSECPSCPAGTTAEAASLNVSDPRSDAPPYPGYCVCVSPCERDADCAAVEGARCRPRFPQLVCELPCATDADCPPDLACVHDRRGVRLCAALIEPFRP